MLMERLIGRYQERAVLKAKEVNFYEEGIVVNCAKDRRKI